MSSEDNFKYRRPFSPDEAVEQQMQQWHTPDLTAARPAGSTRTNVFNKTAPEARSRQAEIEQELVIKPLTADDIEQIRQAGYDEGFAEGKEEGFSKGYAEGREQGLDAGTQQGLAEGKKAGLAAGEAELTAQLQQLALMFDQLQQPLAQLNDNVKQQVLQLSLAMAQAVIAVEVKTNTDVILQAISDATTALPLQSKQMLIKLNPADISRVEQFYSPDELTQRNWQLRAEPAIAQGGCVVESTMSSVDRTLQQRVQSSLDHFIQMQRHAEDVADTNANVDIEEQTALDSDIQSGEHGTEL